MSINQWLYLVIIATFVVVFVSIVAYYFNGKRYDKVENPKFKILENENEAVKTDKKDKLVDVE